MTKENHIKCVHLLNALMPLIQELFELHRQSRDVVRMDLSLRFEDEKCLWVDLKHADGSVYDFQFLDGSSE